MVGNGDAHAEVRSDHPTWARARVRASRTVLDGPEEWTIREIEAGAIPGARGDFCLVLESASMVRRRWKYPPNWASLESAKLVELIHADVAD